MIRPLRSRHTWRILRWIFYGAAIFALIAGCASVLYLVLPPPPMNILIVGIDDGEQGRVPMQPNSMLLVNVDPALLRVSVLNLPGDVLVDVPEIGEAAINQLGDDPQRWRAALTATLGVRIDRYVRLDFETFAALVDAVDGIVVDVERVIEDERYPAEETVDAVRRVRFESGVQRMDGARALQYARIIGSYGADDRVWRQGQLLLALSLPLRDPRVWPDVWRLLAHEAATDVTLWDIAIRTPAFIFTAGRYEMLTLDEDYAAPGASGRRIDFDAVSEWLQTHFSW